MRHTSILMAGVALALAGAATPGFAHTHRHHMARGLHHPSTQAERQQTAQLNQQQLAQAQSADATMNTGAGMSANGENAAISSSANGTATQQNSLTTEPTSYQRMHGSSGASMNGTAAGNADTPGTAAGTGAAEGEQADTPMNGDIQGNPSGAVSPPPSAGTPQ
jgi:hypothetical protein